MRGKYVNKENQYKLPILQLEDWTVKQIAFTKKKYAVQRGRSECEAKLGKVRPVKLQVACRKLPNIVPVKLHSKNTAEAEGEARTIMIYADIWEEE